tara:strand:- start:4360 stop:5868 length:1509 start_codon:yes stop_codon:yes gene_type:complete
MSAIPDLLKIGAIPGNLAMSVETGILDPVVQNDSFVRFNMKRAGFLHSNSKIALSLKNDTLYPNAAAKATAQRNGQHYTLPQSVGVGSLIERVRLLSGSTVIQEIDNWGELFAYKSQFTSNEIQKEREQYTTGRGVNLDFDFHDGVAATDPTGAQGISLDNGTEYQSEPPAFQVGGTKADRATLRNKSVATAETWSKDVQRHGILSNDPVWQISISDLCPFLRQTQLPLFMFEEQIFLEITFKEPIKRAVGNPVAVTALVAGGVATGDPAFTINAVETKLIIDYITYPNETMEAWAQANQNFSFQYTDYELSKFTVANDQPAFIRNIGGAGRMVKQAIMGLQNDGGATGIDFIQNLFGGFMSFHPPGSLTLPQDGRVVTNLRYNDEFLYPIDVRNDAYHFNNVVQAEGSVPFITRQMYSDQGDEMESKRCFGGRAGWNYESGRTFWQTARLNDNDRINQKGIELYQQYVAQQGDIGNFTMRIWLEVVKVATLRNGRLETEYA